MPQIDMGSSDAVDTDEDVEVEDGDNLEWEEEPEKETELKGKVSKQEDTTRTAPQTHQEPQVQTRQEVIQPGRVVVPDEDSLEIYNSAKESALLLGLEEKKAEAFAVSQTMMLKKQMDKLKGGMLQLSAAQFGMTEAGAAYQQIRQIMPSMTPQMAMEFVQNMKGNKVMMEGQSTSKMPSDELSREEREIAKIWGISHKDMKAELKRYDRGQKALANEKDAKRMYEIGRIKV